MSGRRITKLDIEEKLRWLGAIYRKPDDIAAAADVWAQVLRGISYQHFDDALALFVRENESGFFPKPAQIRKLALAAAGRDPKARPTDLRARYQHWESHQEGNCPVCGAALGQLTKDQADLYRPGAEGRLFVIHDAERHRQEGVPHVGIPYYEPPVPAEEKPEPQEA